MANIPSGYSDIYNQLADNMIAKTGEVKYDPQSISTLKSALQRVIRPNYDKQIQSLRESLAANQSAIDADAAARGIGPSSWVTDAKSKALSQQTRNLNNIESDYNATLYNALLNRQAEQDEMYQQAQLANQGMRANALGAALSPAMTLYNQSRAAAGGSGGRRGGSNPKTGDVYDLDGFGNYALMGETRTGSAANVPRTGTVEYTGNYSSPTYERAQAQKKYDPKTQYKNFDRK